MVEKVSEIDLDRFAAVVKTKRGSVGLRAVAAEIGGISAPTLSRIEQGNMPDLETFVKICRWLGESPNSFIFNNEGLSPEIMDTDDFHGGGPQKIEAFLRAENTLPKETVEALSSMVRLAYKAAGDGTLVSE